MNKKIKRRQLAFCSAHNRPTFAMKGSTRLCWTINPYAKCGVDAAKLYEESFFFKKAKENSIFK